MKYLNITIAIILLYCLPVASEIFHWPIDGYFELTSSFGEYRDNHLHKGIDISTNGKNGIPVCAIEDGQIFRISNSYKGYGKVIYIMHKNHISVYAHLDKFENTSLFLEDKYNMEKNKKNKDFFNYYLNPVNVKKGQLIGYSGETGYGYPHLHLEIRDKKNTIYYNPLYFFEFEDKKNPVINNIYITPLNEKSVVNSTTITSNIELIEQNNGFYTSKSKIPFIPGSKIRFSVDTYDIVKENSANKLGIYGLELYKGLRKLYSREIKTIPINDFLISESWHEYSDTNLGPTKYTYRIYDPTNTDGEITLEKETVIKLKVYDYFGNTAIALIEFIPETLDKYLPLHDFKIKSKPYLKTGIEFMPNHYALILGADIIPDVLPWSEKNDIKTSSIFDGKNFIFSFLYTDLPHHNIFFSDVFQRIFQKSKKINVSSIKNPVIMGNFLIESKDDNFYSFHIDKQNGHENAISSILEIGPKNRFIKKHIEISTKKINEKSSFYKKNSITGKWSFIPTQKNQNNLSIKTYQTGLYCIIQDNEPPEITYVKKAPYYYIYFTDNISGINPDSIKVRTDNIKQYSYFDIDRKMVSVYTDENTTEINISVRDNEHNLTVKTIEINERK
ncbi:MAG: M23 family metallopeptidase [Candidatus Muirbacterium halophilum]|nr:M23 family metallopeptidase [Candidatus Muirbacterium halophilum]